MDNAKKLTGNYIHDLFCEMMECEKMDEQYFQLHSLDDIDYFNILRDEGIDDSNIAAQYKHFKDGHIEMYVNEYDLNNEPYVSMDVILSQLFDLYSTTMPFYENTYAEAHRIKFIKSASEGYKYWFEFSCSFMSMKLLRLAFADIDLGEEYSDESLTQKYKEILKTIHTSEENIETKISTIIYLFGKLAYLDNISEGEIKSLLKLKKSKFFDINETVDGDLGKAMNDVYQLLIKSSLMPIKIFDYAKLAKLMNKMKTILSSEG